MLYEYGRAKRTIRFCLIMLDRSDYHSIILLTIRRFFNTVNPRKRFQSYGQQSQLYVHHVITKYTVQL